MDKDVVRSDAIVCFRVDEHFMNTKYTSLGLA